MADTAALLEKITRYKDYLESETDDVLRDKYKKMIEKFEGQLAEVEQKVGKEEEKLEKKEEKAMDEVSEKLKKYTEMMNDSDDEDVKSMYKKKIEKLKAQIGEVKDQIKEEKKELEQKKDDLKEAVKEVKAAEKSVRKVAIKKVEKTEKDRKEISKSKKERRRRLTSILTDLNRLVEETPSLRAKYKDEGVDLKRDAGRGSKPFGWRFKGKNNFRKPRPDQHGQPNVYYEGRANRADVKRKGNVKLEDGGVIEDFMGAGFTLSNADKYTLTSYQPNPQIFGYFENMYDFQKWIKKNVDTDGVTFDSEYSMISIEGSIESLEELVNAMIAAASLKKPGKTEEPDYSSLPKYNRPRRRQIDLGEMGAEFAKGGSVRGFSVGDSVKYKGKDAEYHAKILQVVDDKDLPYAKIQWIDNNKVEEAYLEDLVKLDLRKADEYVNTEYMEKMRKEWKEKHKMAKGGEAKGRYKVTYEADGEPQTEIWESKEMAVSAAKRYAKMDEFTNAKVFDEAGKEVKYSEGGETPKKKRNTGGKWHWKPEAIDNKLIPKSAMKKMPSKYYRKRFPNLVEYRKN